MEPLPVDSVVRYNHPMGGKAQLAMYGSIGIATFLVLSILVYTVLTHAAMDRLVSNPSLAALTKSRFFALLTIAGPIAGASILLASAIKIHHECRAHSQLAAIQGGDRLF